MTDYRCGIGISSIFDTVFRYLPIFLTVLRYWVPPNVPLFEVGDHLRSGSRSGSFRVVYTADSQVLRNYLQTKMAQAEQSRTAVDMEQMEDEIFNEGWLDDDDFDLDEKEINSLEENLQRIEKSYLGNPKHYTLFSGGANGSDLYWQNLSAKFGVRVKAFSFEAHGKRNSARVVLTEEQLKQADEYLHKANITLKRHFPTTKNFVNNLLRRNWYQIKNTNGVFAVGKLSTSRSIVEGGTGWAVQMAIDARKPVYVFDTMSNSWQRYEYGQKKFIFCKVPRLTLNFTGIGTRALSEKGKAAIDKTFEETFGKLSKSSR